MSEQFSFDVFFSHSAKDKPVVRAVAEKLRADGVRVWFDEWEIRPGDSIPAKIEEGLERSRVLVLCMSANAFGSDWAKLEAGTFRFRDPLNKDRRFIPLRLDDATAKGSLAQFRYIDWQVEVRWRQYEALLGVCRQPKTELTPAEQAARERLQEKVLSLGHTDSINSVVFSPDGHRALSGSSDRTVRLWEVETGFCLHVLEGHSDSVCSVAWSLNGRRALSAASDHTVRLWDVETGVCLRVLEGHYANVWSVAWSPDGRRALSAASDYTVRLWEVETGICLRVLEGHSAGVLNVAWSPDGRCALSGSADHTVRLWEVETGLCLRVLEGHSDSVGSVAWSPDGSRALSGSSDHTVRLWEVETGICLCEFEGHSDSVFSVAWSHDGRRALSGSDDHTVRLWEVKTGLCLRVLEGHYDRVLSVSWSPDGRRTLSAASDHTVRLWEVKTGACLRVLEGHSANLLSVAWSLDGSRVLSGSSDRTVRLWGVETGLCLREFEGRSDSVVFSVAWSHDGRRALSGSSDHTVRLWEVETGLCLRVLEGHSARVLSVAWSSDGYRALSGSYDHTVRLWEVETGLCLRVLEGHSARILSVAWNRDGRRAMSGCEDRTVRLWEVETGLCLRVLEGHSDSVLSVAWSPDGRRALSGSKDKTVRLWEVETGLCLRVLEGHSNSVLSVAWSPDGRHALSAAQNGVMRVWDVTDSALGAVEPADKDTTQEHLYYAVNQVQYTNAKVLLVGESGAGKTGLSMRLALDKWEPSDSTVGAWATRWSLPPSAAGGVEREIWLWDFGGQADQRLIPHLYIENTALAVFVFDGQKEDVLETLGQWDRDLTGASDKVFNKLLVVGRVDAGGLRVSRSELERFGAARGFSDRIFETSAKSGVGCDELKEAILAGIAWESIPWSPPLTFKRLKEEILRLKDKGRVLMRFNELRDALRLSLSGAEFKDEELKAVVGLLAGPGVVWELKFGGWVLLQPEYVNAYAQGVIQTLRADEHECGAIAEERVLRGDLMYQSPPQRLEPEEERVVLLAMLQRLVERGLCLREQTESGPWLIFPSYYRRERPELSGYPAVLVSYRFNGFLDGIYATLVVRLHHAQPFQPDKLWRYAADFKTLTGKQLGLKLTRRAEGAGELEVYFDRAILMEEKIIFTRYVHEHLLQKAQDVVRLRHYVCGHCGTQVGNREVAMKRLNAWLAGRAKLSTVACANCEKRIRLWDDLEQCCASPEIQQRARERALVEDVNSTVASAGQLSREFNVSDHGIDMEIEFKNDAGEATGRKLYLQLKSGDSYLRERRRDKAELFLIKDERHARYWMGQAFPVLLVIRNSDGEIRWMEVRDWLKQATDNGRKPVKQIPFEGERFDVMSVRRWRDRVL